MKEMKFKTQVGKVTRCKIPHLIALAQSTEESLAKEMKRTKIQDKKEELNFYRMAICDFLYEMENKT